MGWLLSKPKSKVVLVINKTPRHETMWGFVG